MAYTKQTWADLPSKTTPINANRLTHIEDGIFNAAQTADTAASTAGTAAANVGIVSGKVETLTERVNGLDTAVSNKVDKVAGKGLSTNDYDNTDKGKVDSLGTASTKNSTSVVTESSDLVESGAVYDAIEDTVGWIGGNLLIYPYDAQTATYAWGTVTVNDDGSITVNGTTTERIAIKLEVPAKNYNLPNGNYILSLENAQSGTALLVEGYNGTTWFKLIGTANVGNPSASISIDHNGYTNLSVYISIESGTTLNNVTFKPMLSKRGGSFKSYHASVEESLEQKCDNSVIGTVEDGTNPTRAYAVGEHMIRGGKFCTCIVPVTTASTWSDSYYVEGDIAKILDKKTGDMTFADSGLSSSSARVTEKSGVVCVSASVYTTTSRYTQNQNVLVATISGVAKPDSEVRFPVINSNGSIMTGLLTTGGDIYVYNYSATSGGTITFNFSYEV